MGRLYDIDDNSGRVYQGDPKAINKAFQEDEAVKKSSEQNSRLYLKEIDNEDDRTPLWCLCGIWFCLGILFTVVYTNFDWMGIIKELIT
jgi:hypothetical protein